MDGSSDSILNRDLRPAETLAALSMFLAFFNRAETQLADADMVEEALLSVDEWDRESWDIEHQQHRDFFDETMIPHSRYAAAILLFMIVETRLKAECLAIGRERGIEVHVSEFRRAPLERCKKFLFKKVGISVGDYHEWQILIDLQRVRDCIAHCAGEIDISDDRKELEKLIARKIGVDRTARDTIGISEQFLRSCVADLRGFFKRLFCAFGWPL